MNEIQIIAASSDQDLMEISELAKIIWYQHFTPIIGIGQIEYMLSHFQSYDALCNQVHNEGYEYYFLNYNGENVGYLAIMHKEDSLFLSKIYIREDYRNKKIAKTAVEFMTKICKEFSFNKIWLTVHRMNLNTIMAYKRLGFVITGEKKTDIGNDFYMDDYVMELPVED